MSSSLLPESGAAPAARRSLLPRSLTIRLVATALLLVAMVSVVVGLVTTVALRHFLMARLDDQLTSASQRFGPPGDPGVQIFGICDPAALNDPRFLNGQAPDTVLAHFGQDCDFAGVVTPRGHERHLDQSDLTTLSHVTSSRRPTTVSLSLGEYRVLAQSGFGSRNVTGLPLANVSETVDSLIYWETGVGLGGVLLAAGLATLLVRRQLRPLRQVAATATNVTRLPLATGEVGTIERVPAKLTDPATEVGQVGSALNAMLGHVEEALGVRHESEQRVRQFLADASHELRTPLSTIMGYAELSRRTPPDEQRMGHAMVRIQSESGRMAALVDDLLLLARLDSGRPLEQADVDLSLLVAEAVNDARVVGSDHAWRLSLPSDALHVVGDRGRLHQVLANLLTNALRHTPPGTTVSVAAHATPGTRERPPGVAVTVADNGPGIPPSLAGKEFERFSRGEASRNRDSGGSGLGLSIVHAIVTAHRGVVTISSRPGETLITVWLPALGGAAASAAEGAAEGSGIRPAIRG